MLERSCHSVKETLAGSRGQTMHRYLKHKAEEIRAMKHIRGF